VAFSGLSLYNWSAAPDPLKEIQMTKSGKSIMAAVVKSALIVGPFCCQKKEGSAERAGKQIVRTMKKSRAEDRKGW